MKKPKSRSPMAVSLHKFKCAIVHHKKKKKLEKQLDKEARDEQ